MQGLISESGESDVRVTRRAVGRTVLFIVVVTVLFGGLAGGTYVLARTLVGVLDGIGDDAPQSAATQ